MTTETSENFLFSESLQSEIKELRLKCEDTQELYWEVCGLLFFRYGVTPTANKLYQLVRKGSMSAPAEALGRFWKTLREKSRIRIECPDLPVALREVVGEMTGALWQRAQALAHESLDATRNEAQTSVLMAQSATEQAEIQAKLAQESREEIQVKFRSCEENLRSVEQKLAKEEGEKVVLQRQLEDHAHQRHQIHEALKTSQQEFAAELERQRITVTALEERYQVNLQRAVLETERERSNLLKLQEELEKTRQSAAEQQCEIQNAFRISQQEFTAELERQRIAAAAVEKRYHDDFQRTLREVDHERSNLLKVRDELEQVRSAATEQAERDRSSIDVLHHECAS